MSWGIVAAVLFGALLHALWNGLIKAGSDKALGTALMHSMGVALAVPVVAVVGLPPPAAWPWIAGSATLHIGYYFALAGAYRHGDLGLTYPVMRGSAPLLVALASLPVIGERLAAPGWLGVAGISAGVLLVGLSGSSGNSPSHGKALRFALLNAVIIAGYTVVDGMGVRAGGNALQYVATLFLVNSLPYFTLVMYRRGAAERPAAWAYMARRWKLSLLGTLASAGSYGIALWAMTQAPVAAVAALRETSVLFAAVIGASWLKEGFGARRAAGTALIVAGVMSLRLLA